MGRPIRDGQYDPNYYSVEIPINEIMSVGKSRVNANCALMQKFIVALISRVSILNCLSFP